MQKSRIFFLQVAGSLGAATFLSLMASNIAFWRASYTWEANRQVQATQQFSHQLNNILLQLKNAENGKHRYLLTSDVSALQPYTDALLSINQDIEFLQQATVNNPTKQERVKKLKELAQNRLNLLKEGLEARDRQGIEAAIAWVRLNQGRLVMSQLEDEIRELNAQSIWALHQQQQIVQTSIQQTGIAFGVGMALNLLIFAWVYRLIDREIRTRMQAEQKIQQLNADLEQRVVQRTAELQQAIEEAEAANQVKSESLDKLNLEMMERKQTEMVLQNQTKLIQIIFNSMSDGVIVADENAQLLNFNPAAKQMFGNIINTQQEKWAERYGLFLPDQVTPMPTAQIPLVRAVHGEQVANVEVFIRHPDASQGIWLMVSGSPLKDASGALKGGLVVCRDISDRKSVELKTLRAKEAAEAANRAKSEFLANMNHELRTPLNGILGYAQILQRDPATTEKQLKGLGVIQQCGSHLLTLINDILDLAKLEVHKMELYAQDFHLTNFLTTTVEICRVKAEQKGIAFHYQPAANLPIAIHADDKRLRQVLLNLLSNAVKFTDFGSVTFRVEPVEPPAPSNQNPNSPIQRIRFEIEDTGIGVPPEKLDAIFLPFEQAGQRERNSEGTGLGLAISQQIVQIMGSTIQIKSTLGRGSTFWFEVDLPATTDWLSQPAIAHEKVIGYEGKQRKILVIDDRKENRIVIIGMLAPLGFELAEAEDGQAGLDTAIQMRPDLIITDVMMSQMTGLEMTRRLRQLPDFTQIPIIASPATLSQVDMQEAIDAGCNSFFPKPIEFNGLLGELQRHLELQWIYESPPKKSRSVNSTDSTNWVVPPSEELVVLYKAAQDGFMADIQREANRLKLDLQYAPFANRLLELSQKFDDEAILNLLQPYVQDLNITRP